MDELTLARVRVRLLEVRREKARPVSDSPRRAEHGYRCLLAEGHTVLSLHAIEILTYLNGQRAISQERKVVVKSYSHDCVQLAEIYARMSSPFSYDTWKFENLAMGRY